MNITGTTLISNTTFSEGGAIDSAAHRLILANSTLVGNSSSSVGAIFNEQGNALLVTNSTVRDNATFSYGGGIYNQGSTALVINSTVSGNTASAGGGIYTDGFSNHSHPSVLLLTADTIASNAGNVVNSPMFGPSYSIVTGTIIATSTSGPNCTGIMTEQQGYNLDSGASCGFSQTTDLTTTDPLADHGGPTMALLPGSPAIDHGGTGATGCPASDQRSLPRSDEAGDNGACDIGAQESQSVG